MGSPGSETFCRQSPRAAPLHGEAHSQNAEPQPTDTTTLRHDSTCGDSPEPYLAGAVIEADLVPDEAPQGTAHLLGHSLGHRDGGNAPGLGDTDGPLLGEAYGRDGEKGDTELCCSVSVYTLSTFIIHVPS